MGPPSDYEYDGGMVGNQLGWNDNDYNLITKDGQYDYETDKDAAKRATSGNGAGGKCSLPVLCRWTLSSVFVLP